MVLQMARMLLSEFVHVVSPWRHAPMGGSLVAQHGVWGLAGVGSAGCDSRESDDLFGPLWFAVPKKRVSRRFCLFATDSQHQVCSSSQQQHRCQHLV